MELCEYSLAEWLRRQGTAERDLPRMIGWFKQMVTAVAYIHDHGLIHRDLKPSNILFSSPDHLNICDFGITTHIQLKLENETEVTATYPDIGSALYMAPEQSGWRYTSKVDVFTLGLILAELCVYMTVFDRKEAEFVSWLSQVDKSKRPTCREMLKHSFLE
ncbi:hypothetical protein PRIPAC_90954 [Pristionchus pacificus]|uniref:Protein kinase domain-containing protein n=1 Tax=Pristionchus pacificus TaxID=54126 RepID=A0A2A6CXJ1_PRIPA|nr:hypothetical protein PRIPAC_90954 [Pristionchus pacificus]|eukprot:PDM82741.1 protein kinase [Pristionchus pacificus]